MGKGKANRGGPWGLLARLLGNRRGNTLALIAGVIFPLLGLLGGGIDMSRLYLTKTRVQHACDAGALAGRKAMGSLAWTTGTNSTEATALAMFDGNFQQNDYGTGVRSRSYAESNGSVTGTATVDVPMTVMRVFGFTNRSLTVTCTAKMAIPNTDVMFVLDNTGSMNCVAGDIFCSNNGNVPAVGGKILGLKTAVKCFYEALLKVNTTEVCGNDPAATSYIGTAQLRIGFVPYTVNVNVGRLLPNSYLADAWNYQTRHGVFYSLGVPASGSYNESTNFSRSSSCTTWQTSDTSTGWPSKSSTPTTFTITTNDYSPVGYNSQSDVCTRRVDQQTVVYTRDDTNGTYFHTWIYQQDSLDVSGLKAGGSNWNSATGNLRIGDDGNSTTLAWDGCIEERQTVKNSDGDPSDEWNPIPTAAKDMDIDTAPTSDTTTQWGPLLDGAVWPRYTGSSSKTLSTSTGNSNSYYGHPSDNGSYYCPAAAKKLQTWYTPAAFETYVNSMVAIGNTYHDIGMIWGGRLISPTGLFASENTNLTNIQRHIIFMTDGDTMSYNDDYTAYGVSWWDRRQTTYAPANNSGTDSDTAKIINARTAAICTAIKNKNITLWVVSYGGGINAATEARLQACASSGKYLTATDTPTLIANFKQIASAIAQLRLTN